jgi:hypothetical protein
MDHLRCFVQLVLPDLSKGFRKTAQLDDETG